MDISQAMMPSLPQAILSSGGWDNPSSVLLIRCNVPREIDGISDASAAEQDFIHLRSSESSTNQNPIQHD